jgi:hypothetical protein
MMSRLESEALRADLASVESLLRERTPEQDPVGHFQFSQRKAELESKVAELRQAGGQPAAVALYFGGRPVIGSRGVLAEFGTKAVDSFQTLVATRFAALEGPLGQRGPVPQRERSALMITEVAHGSFGFVLEEADAPLAPELPMTSLTDVVDEVCGLIHSLAASDESADTDLEGIPEALDKRVLGCLQSFFRLLSDAGATLRVIEDRREFSLRSDMIARARERTDAMNVEESSERIEGRLFLLPDARRFELHPVGGGPSLKGAVAAEALGSVTEPTGDIPPGLIGSIAVVELRVRELRFKQQPGKRSYQLVSIDAPARQSA